MIKKIIFSLLIAHQSFAQSFAPPAGYPGSTAIYKDSSIIVDWATESSITRGYQNIADQSIGFADYGDSTSPVGISNGTWVVSLGDGGEAIVQFQYPITNGPGADFAVFENGFSDDFLELAFVEVSSDGVNYFRFPAISETQTEIQIGGFGLLDCRYVHNLAGKYRAEYGTPFDLEDLVDSIGINLDAISHVKIIDVVGSIDAQYGSYDYLGALINDPFPTPFGSSGFDLDAIGVINSSVLSLESNEISSYSIFPNPTNGVVSVNTEMNGEFVLIDQQGRIIEQSFFEKDFAIHLENEQKGVYFLKIISELGVSTERIIKK